MKWTLKKRIVISVVVLIAGLTAGTSVIAYLRTRSALESELEQQLEQLCAASVREVENWVDFQRRNLVQWASRADHHGALVETAADEMSARDRAGAELLNAKTAQGVFEDIHLLGMDGTVVASSDPSAIGSLNVSDRSYFRSAASGSIVVSEVLKSRITGAPVVTIAVPVTVEGAVRGVLCGMLDLNSFSEQFVAPIKVCPRQATRKRPTLVLPDRP